MKLDEDTGLVLVNYKEPLKRIASNSGFGYYGAILMTPDGLKMQCHVCGLLFDDVGTHARQKHSLSHTDYREAYMLAKTTALISEGCRESRKNRTLLWLSTLTVEQKAELTAKARAGSRKWRRDNPNALNTAKPIALETKNKRGTCPDQLLAKINEATTALGHTPSKEQFIDFCGSQRYVHLIYKTFGSFKKAVARAGLPAYQPAKGGRKPEAMRSDEELLDMLLIFWKEEGKVPTETDCRRGFLPHSDVFRRRFGGMPQARELAGINEEPIGRWGNKP